jgi:PAS domain S-box-containing protein
MLLDRIPLTVKMLLLTLLVGVATWAALDAVQTGNIEQTFRAYLESQLAVQAESDRASFDERFKSHAHAAKLFISQERFNEYLDRLDASGWAEEANPKIVSHKSPPAWFPKMSVARAFMQARYYLLLDPDGRVREVFQDGPVPPPDTLLHPGGLVTKLSRNQALMTGIDGGPFIISTENATRKDGSTRAAVMLASPVDDVLLMSSQRFKGHYRIVALFTGSPPRSLAATRPEIIPHGTLLDGLEDKYLIAGKSFFDYGSSGLRVQFVSLVPLSEVEAVTSVILAKERRQRALTALALLLSFALVMLWITRNIRKLTRDVQEFSRDVLGSKSGPARKGDQLVLLMEEFRTLTREVIATREALNYEAEEKVRLARKASEARLIERERNLLQHVMEILGVGVISSREGDLSAANSVMDEFARDCGGLQGFVPPGEAGYEEIKLAGVDGHDRHFTVVRFNSPDEDKDYMLVHDVTESRVAVESLKDSEGRARAVTDTATDAIITIDDKGRITYWNPAAARTFGYTAEEVMGKDVHDLLTPPKYIEAARKGLRRYLSTGEGPAIGITRVLSALRKDGAEFPVELSLSSFRTKGKLNSVGLIRDISERVKAEKDKDAMFHMMTHDIKGPLSIIYGYSELLAQQLGDREEGEMVFEMQKATGRISALIEDMLSLSRLESGANGLSLETVRIHEIVNIAVMDCLTQATEMGVTVDLALDDDCPEFLADRNQLGRAIANLAINAVNYNRAGGKVTIRAGAVQPEGGTPGSVFVEVSDTGIGIPEGDIDRVFDKYYRSKASSGRRGTGLGLAIVKAAVESHGGTVSVTSIHGEGSTFRVVIPMNPPV